MVEELAVAVEGQSLNDVIARLAFSQDVAGPDVVLADLAVAGGGWPVDERALLAAPGRQGRSVGRAGEGRDAILVRQPAWTSRRPQIPEENPRGAARGGGQDAS